MQPGVLGAALVCVLAWGLVACADESLADGSGGDGGGPQTGGTSATQAGTGDGQSVGTGDATSTTSGTGGSTSSESATGSGGGDCDDVGATLDDPDADACAHERCCSELTVCAEDPSRCFHPGTGDLDLSLPDAQALQACLDTAVCPPSGCGAGIHFGSDDPDFDQCVTEACCDELTTCADGAPQPCVDCLNAGPPWGDLCAPVDACASAECGRGLANGAVCDSGIVIDDDIELAQCLTDSCCTEYTACTGGDPEDEDAIQACIDCFVDEGGPLCDAAIACGETNCGESPR